MAIPEGLGGHIWERSRKDEYHEVTFEEKCRQL